MTSALDAVGGAGPPALDLTALRPAAQGHRRGYEALHRWSVDEPGRFWAAAWDLCGLVGERGDTAFVPGATLPEARFFPDARLNVVETFLATTGPGDALVEAGEDGRRRTLSWDELRAQVAALAAALGETGVGPGDRVAAWLPNIPETIVTMLATAAVGATFSSTSPDFGTAGRARPLRPDRADGARRRRRLRLRRQGQRLPGPPGRDPRRPARPPAHDRGARTSGRHVPDGDRRLARRARRPTPAPSCRVERHPVRPPLVRPLLLGDDGHAEGHRPPRRRRAAQAPGRAPAPLRRPARRPGLLLHDRGLDDVELAGLRAGLRGDPRPLRRLALAPAVGPVRPGRRAGRHALRHVGQVHRRPRPRRARPVDDPRPDVGAHDHLDRLAARPRGLRLRVRAREGRRPPGVDLGRHRPVRLPRRR